MMRPPFGYLHVSLALIAGLSAGGVAGLALTWPRDASAVAQTEDPEQWFDVCMLKAMRNQPEAAAPFAARICARALAPGSSLASQPSAGSKPQGPNSGPSE